MNHLFQAPSSRGLQPLSTASSLRSMLLACGVLLSLTINSLAQEMRYWTTKDGIQHRGSLMFMSGKNVTLKGPAGMISLPLNKLSDEDLVFISQSKTKAKGLKNPGIPMSQLPPGFIRTKTPPTNTRPPTQNTNSKPTKVSVASPATGIWPTTVKTTFSPADIKTVSETKREGYIYRSPHFEFRSPIRLPHRAVRQFSLVFESTYDLAKAMPIGLNPQPGGNGYYVTELYETKEDYYENGGMRGSSGSFFPSSGKIRVPLPSLGVVRTQNNIKVARGAASNTLIHEVTHQVMMRWLPIIPIWMGEGFAEITSALPYESGYFRLSRMSKAVRMSTGQGPSAGRAFDMPHLQQLMNISSNAWSDAVAKGNSQQNYRAACLLTYYFLRLDGKGKGERLINYVNARKQGANHKIAEEKYLLDGRTYEQLEKEVARAWREEGLKITYQR